MRTQREQPSSQAAPGRGGLRVVLAENDPPLRAVLVEVLSIAGYEVEPVPDGEQLLLRVVRAGLPRAAVSERIDLVVSDVRMPFCSGLDILRKLRLGRRTTPFVLITADADAWLRARAQELGAALLEKPFSPAALLQAAREQLAADVGMEGLRR